MFGTKTRLNQVHSLISPVILLSDIIRSLEASNIRATPNLSQHLLFQVVNHIALNNASTLYMRPIACYELYADSGHVSASSLYIQLLVQLVVC